MKKASIVSVGNELLDGRTVDTNASYISAKLLSVNIPVVSSYTAPDNVETIYRMLKLAGDDADIILLTGGLGPTDDDLTRQAVAKFLDVELKLDQRLLEKMRQFFARRNLEMPENNKKQACVPHGTKAIENPYGTAAGIMAEEKNLLLFATPGVPSEMKKMFEDSILPQLRNIAFGQNLDIFVKKLKCFGTGESKIAQKIGTVMQRHRNPQIDCTVDFGTITLHIVASAKGKSMAEQLAKEDEKLLKDTLGNLIYGEDAQTLAEVVGRLLAGQGKTIAVAESCTGGMLAKLLTDIPGASRYFTYGWITYSNQAKANQLDIPLELIEKYGAVSEQVAEAMAIAAGNKSGADFAIGITGIAGPTGATEQKPVGLVYISLSSDNRFRTERFIFSYDRPTIRFLTAQTALNMLRLELLI
ncbi:MAG: competence/damage-inducible protein A [Planctomycetota bacterium]|jgi:nicotinamide-nucleotide amidase